MDRRVYARIYVSSIFPQIPSHILFHGGGRRREEKPRSPATDCVGLGGGGVGNQTQYELLFILYIIFNHDVTCTYNTYTAISIEYNILYIRVNKISAYILIV